MKATAKETLNRVCVIVLAALAISIGSGVSGPRVLANQEGMEDMCSGEMQWMVGWCIDMMMPAETDGDVHLMAGAAVDGGAFESIDVPGATATRAFGINPQGDVVGSFTDATGTHAFLLRNGVFTQIDYPGARATEAWGINARGDIIGRYTVADRRGTLGFLLTGGRFFDISIPSATAPDGKHLVTLPTKIGASGEIVGCYHDINGFVDMFGYVQRGQTIDTFTLPSTIGPASAMHNGVIPGGRTIVGLTLPAVGRARGYVLSDDTLTYLDFPGSAFTQAWDVSPTGTVIGDYRAGGRAHGFYWNANGFVTVDVPGSTLTLPRGINPSGVIVGVYNDASGTHGFLHRP